MMEIFTINRANQKLSVFIMIVMLLTSFIISSRNVQAQVTNYYVGGTSASDSNPGTSPLPFATIQKAATIAMAGDVVNIRTGTYRETITPANSGTPGNPIVYQPDGGAMVSVSGADIADGGWSVYSGNIYQKTISLPVNGYNDHATNNTTLMANQVFVNSNMMIEARWPNVSDSNDLMKKSDFRDGTIGAWGSVPQLRINCGGHLIEGNQLEDKPFTPESWGYTGFSGAYSTVDTIINTYSVYDAMKTARYGAGHYLITTQNGTYQVKMDFAEIVDTSSSRKFNIKVEGQTVASNVDIFTLAGGHDRGYEFVFMTQVTDGQMDIEFVAVNGQPMVSEIELNYLRPATLTDPAIPQITGGWVGGQIWVNGWYQTYTSPITAQNGTQITFDKSAAAVFRKFYYLTGRLGALDAEKEWFYDGTTLYLWAPGSGSPANVEVKKRNYAFDLSGKSYITIKDIKIFASTIISNSSSANIVVDGINAKYISHYVTHPSHNSSGPYIQGGSGHMLETGILLMGPDNVIQNSEIQYSAGNGIVLGESGAVAHNNLIHDISYGGKFECAIFPAPNLNNNTVGIAQTITRNTAYRLGRSAIHGIYMNKDIGYNDFYAYGLLNNDVGALYSDCIANLPNDPGVNCAGTRIHHNWLHDCAADERQGSGIYFDQGSGGGSQVDHNVIWNTLETDAYSEIINRTQIKWYNNTFGSSKSDEVLYSWLSYYVGGVNDDAKNNIYNMPFHRGAWKQGGNENYFTSDNSLNHSINPLFVNNSTRDFHLQPNSPAINTGIVISGVTDGYVGDAPDKGAYEYGGTDWVPGYVAPGIISALTTQATQQESWKGKPADFSHGLLRVSDNQHFLQHADGKPFFYLGETAWELFHRLNREEATFYLKKRASQGFNVIQAVALADLPEGLFGPNAYGFLPLENFNPATPAIKEGPDNDYWDHVDFVVNMANELGMYVGFLPTWGSHWNDGKTPLFNEANAEVFGEFVGKRYKDKELIWILGGDRLVINDKKVALMRAMAKGIRKSGAKQLITLHPSGGSGSADWVHNEPWMDFNMRQNGHAVEFTGRYNQTYDDYQRIPTKPVIDGEPVYEDHPIAFDPEKLGHTVAADVRRPLYWDLFTGACGHTYGHHSVWQMYDPKKRKPMNRPLLSWQEAIDQPGASQMMYGRKLIESRPFLSRIPDASILVAGEYTTAMPGEGRSRFVATRDQEGTYAMIYAPIGRKFTVRMDVIKGDSILAWWYNPRNGKSNKIGIFSNQGQQVFISPDNGEYLDWVLVLDDVSKQYPAPGTILETIHKTK